MGKVSAVIAVAVAIALVAGPVSAQSIGVFSDPAGNSCEFSAAVGQSFTLYILATLGGGASGGMTGAEFRVAGIPAGWTTSEVANPAAGIVFGDPMGAGTNITFPTCQTGTGGKVLLFTVTVNPSTVVSDVILKVEMHTTPSNASFQCPLVTLCDPPAFTKLCVCGGQGVINGTIQNCGCGDPSPTEATTWGHLKSLYW